MLSSLTGNLHRPDSKLTRTRAANAKSNCKEQRGTCGGPGAERVAESELSTYNSAIIIESATEIEISPPFRPPVIQWFKNVKVVQDVSQSIVNCKM